MEPPPSSSSLAAGTAAQEDGYCLVEQVKTKTKTILHRMALDFPENAITAIMGPSGSGKTTLLSVVTESVHSNVEAQAKLHLPSHKAFVPQDDRLHGFYTTKSYLQHYAHLSGGLNLTPEQVNARIDKLLHQLGLAEQADTIVGDLFLKGLSGGQQRRLSVALEALTEPQTLFLDEPTSGLDSESALKLMEFLKQYVRQASGRRVILTIHQPGAFVWQLIDHVILLSKGKLMYNGSRTLMEGFFADVGVPTQPGWNNADHYIGCVNDEFRDQHITVDQWAEHYRQWLLRQKHNNHHRGTTGGGGVRTPSMVKASAMDSVATSRSSSPTVIIELTKRYFMNLAFNPGILFVRVAMYSALALMVGILFFELGDRIDYESVQSRIALLFYCVAFFVFMSVAVLPFTVMERAIVDKEVLNGYYNPIYYQISQGISSIFGTALLAFVTTIIVMGMTKMNEPFWYYLTMFLSLMVAEALAQLVSHVVPHFVIGMALVAGAYGFFMLLQGFMIVPSDFPSWLKWAHYIAFHTYAWRTFMANEFRNLPVLTGSNFQTGEDILVFYEIENVDTGNDMLVLAFYCLVLHVISCVVLTVRYKMHGTITPITEKQEKLIRMTHEGVSEAITPVAEEEGGDETKASNEEADLVAKEAGGSNEGAEF